MILFALMILNGDFIVISWVHHNLIGISMDIAPEMNVILWRLMAI